MNIELRRYRIKPDTIDGQIFIDGSKVCDCAENAHHCLPPGEYQIIVHKCKQYSRKMLLVGNPAPQCGECQTMEYCGNNSTLPKFCPMIKPGNGVFNRTDGAIIVGCYLAPGCLSHPKVAFDTLYERIRKNSERGNKITLTVQNSY